MDDIRIALVLRALRHRLAWTQSVLAAKAGVSQQLVSRVERGDVGRLTVDTLRKVAGSVGVRSALDPQWRGPALERLLDADHSRLAQLVKSWLESWKWLVEVEVTFSRYGERGSIDLLAFHPRSGILLVIEIKTLLPDLQAMLRSLDAKLRLARAEATRFGWKPTSVSSCLVLMETTTNRRRVSEFSGILSRFVLRGRQARRWMRAPSPLDPGVGLLLLSKLPPTSGGSARRAGRQRVRPSRSISSVQLPPEPPLEVPIRA